MIFQHWWYPYKRLLKHIFDTIRNCITCCFNRHGPGTILVRKPNFEPFALFLFPPTKVGSRTRNVCSQREPKKPQADSLKSTSVLISLDVIGSRTRVFLWKSVQYDVISPSSIFDISWLCTDRFLIAWTARKRIQVNLKMSILANRNLKSDYYQICTDVSQSRHTQHSGCSLASITTWRTIASSKPEWWKCGKPAKKIPRG